ncbi:MAG: fused MFS/spermidine synthase, partial [Spirochaetes bacterium]|nr:fused MFS/spermidine synthase [Spirochaetota bacterium]
RTPFQAAELVETEALGRVLLLDGVTQVSERWEERYHEPLVHPALLAHPDPRRVLVLGGGDGGVLREVLRHRTVESVDFAELDPDVVAFCREHLGHVHRGAFDDARVRFRFGDGRAFVEAAGADYDAVIMDMTDPAGPARFLYTAEFFLAVKRSLRDERAVFAMHGESPAARPAAFACIGRTLRSAFPLVSTATAFVPMYGTLWSFRYASASSDPSALGRPELERRIAGRVEGPLAYASASMWPALFAPDPLLAEAEAHPDARVVADAEPDFPDAFEV